MPDRGGWVQDALVGSRRRRRPVATALLGLAAGVVLTAGSPAAAAPAPGAPAPLGYTTYGEATTLCTPTDRRLDSISGIASTGRGLYVQADRDSRLWQLDGACRPVREVPLPGVGALVDTEEVAGTPDGTLWVGDIGGNRVSRTGVAVIRVPVGGAPQRFAFGYPDGPHDAETLLVSPDGRQLLIISRVPSGVATVFTPARTPVAGRTVPLEAVGTVRATALPDRNRGDSALIFTGGAVSPDGLHLLLRTYTEAWEWDAPDGDLAAALTGLPRRVDLPQTKQGEAITYSRDGRSILATGEQLDPVFKVAIERPRYAPSGSVDDVVAPASGPSRSMTLAVVVGGAAVCLVVLVAAILVEQRRSRRRRPAVPSRTAVPRVLSRRGQR